MVNKKRKGTSGRTIHCIMLWNKHCELTLKNIPSSTKLEALIVFHYLLLKMSLLTNAVKETVS